MQDGFWNDEVHSEIIESGMTFKFCTVDDRETCMMEIESMRRQSLYGHECFEGCKERGQWTKLNVNVCSLYSQD